MQLLINAEPFEAYSEPGEMLDFDVGDRELMRERDGSAGDGPTNAGGALSVFASVPTTVLNALRQGLEPSAIRMAVFWGIRDVDRLTNLVFFARHPERDGRPLRRGEPQFARLSREWLEIRDRLIRPALVSPSDTTATSAPATATTTATTQPSGVIERIDQYGQIIDTIAPTHQVDPNIVRGIIAAESGGNPRSGEQNARGYKGLMQAGTGVEQLDPETSIRSGVKHFANKRRVIANTLQSFGIDLSSLDSEALLRFIMTAYNAGEGTLKKALEYARIAGDIRNWERPEHFQRALLFTGAYSVRAPLDWCLRKLPVEVAASALSNLVGLDPADLIREYYKPSQGWAVRKIKSVFGQAIIAKLYAENRRLRHDSSLTMDKARQKASPLLLCSVEFKHVHRPIYIDTILRYKRYYDQQQGGLTR